MSCFSFNMFLAKKELNLVTVEYFESGIIKNLIFCNKNKKNTKAKTSENQKSI